MRYARDTFLHFLADNLVGVSVHGRRVDISDPSANSLKMNAVNVEFLDAGIDPHISSQQVVIDIINDNELVALDIVNSVSSLLKSAYYTTMLDYSNVVSPVSVGSNLMWDKRGIRFRKIFSNNYSHFSCLLTLRFYVAE